MKKKANANNIISIIALSALIVAFVSYLNFITPLFADDFSYSVSFVTKKPVNSFTEILESQYLHYFTTNGRSVVHTLAQALLAIGKPILNVINGVAFLSLILLICYHALGEMKRIRAWHIALVFACLWFVTPHFGGSFLWIMGSANYMYSPQIILLFLIPYNRFLRGKNKISGKKSCAILFSVLMLVFGVCAGWTNENTTLALIATVISVIIFAYVSKRKISPWMWCGLAGNIIGAAMLFLSPAQSKRLNNAGGLGGISDWIANIKPITRAALINFAIPLVLIAMSFIITLVIRKRKAFSDISPAVIFSIGTAISLYSMCASPEFPATVWSSILAFLLIPTLFFVDRTDIFSDSVANTVITLTLLLVVGIGFAGEAGELHRINAEYDARLEVIEVKNEVETELIYTESTYSPYNLFHEMGKDPAAWPNNAIANYYKIKSIKIK